MRLISYRVWNRYWDQNWKQVREEVKDSILEQVKEQILIVNENSILNPICIPIKRQINENKEKADILKYGYLI